MEIVIPPSTIETRSAVDGSFSNGSAFTPIDDAVGTADEVQPTPNQTDEAPTPNQDTPTTPEPYGEIQQTAFTQELLYQGDSGMNLHLQIKSENFVNPETLEFTPETIAKAQEHGMTPQEIQHHQESIYAQANSELDRVFDEAKLPRGYGREVLHWMNVNFDAREKAIFNRESAQDPVKSMQTLERYYLSEVNK